MLKTILCAMFVLVPPAAWGGVYFDRTVHISSMTMSISGDLKLAASTATASTPTITLDGATGDITADVFIGSVTGNATSATALAANGTNCPSGQAPLGVDASGNAEGCSAVGVGDMVLASTQTVTGGRRYESYSNFAGSATFSSDVTFEKRTATQTLVSSGSFSVTSFSGCNLAGSTVTLTIPAQGDLRFSFGGSIEHDTTDSEIILSILLDGEFLTGYSATTPVMRMTQGNGGQPNNGYFQRVEEDVAAGAHSACLAGWTNAGVVTLQSAVSDAPGYFRMEITR